MTKYGFNIEKIVEIARTAGLKIMEVYQTSFECTIQNKMDNTPVTLADIESHRIIKNGLETLPVSYPVFSEEGEIPSYSERKDIEFFWMVDPLDGTKEFIHRNGDFTVNIALIQRNKPVFGCIYVPVSGEVFWASLANGAFKATKWKTEAIRVAATDISKAGMRILVSRSHLNPATIAFINRFKDPVLLSRGSSVKMMQIAEGKADLYPRLGPTMEWDTAAAQIILEEAGGSILKVKDHTPLEYNKVEFLNPHFVAMGKTMEL